MPGLDTKFDFWIKNNLNVLLVGPHGIGKTERVVEAFTRNQLNFKYFSAATMDPWTDFCGVPKERVDGDNSYLDFVLPKEFAYDKVECIFMDELNRAPEKVRNAIMELLQFKSINGKKFDNLKFIWAAVNPEDDEDTYDVERLDPAQEDRFHVKYVLPVKPDTTFFQAKYGEVGKNAVKWHRDLPNKHKHLVSPRRLEYAIQVYSMGGDVSDVLNEVVMPRSLQEYLERLSGKIDLKKAWMKTPERMLATLNAEIEDEETIDPAKAFKVLAEISVDQFIAYMPKLRNNQWEAVAKDKDLLPLVVRSKTGKWRRKKLDSLYYIGEEKVSDMIQKGMAALCDRNSKIWDALKEVDNKDVDVILEEALEAIKADTKLKEAEVYGLIGFAATRLDGSEDDKHKHIKLLKEIYFEVLTRCKSKTMYHTAIRINPAVAITVIQ